MEATGKAPTFIFVDLPNIIYHGRQKSGAFSMRALFNHIYERRVTPGSELWPIVYWFKYQGNMAHSHSRTAFNAVTDAVLSTEITIDDQPVVMLEAERFKDVDVYLANGIWRSVVGALVRGQKNLRHVLVSNDSDYAQVYRQIKKEVGDHLSLEIHQYGWREGLSVEYKGLATSMTSLDDIRGIHNPVDS